MPLITLDTTAREQFIDITSQFDAILRELHASDGIAHIFCRHTTAGLTVNENADPDVRRDMLLALARIVPEDLDYRHAEGNSPAHVKASLMGCALTLPVSGGRLSLGRWQGVYFCEFDGPRVRRVVEVTFIAAP
ncbi:MAG: secondary thiamine-phosphate synthase enzyme YjbQ [bacterium]|nr:secondary thiamine-phosphate synthase enzyme YjbQ [bacterium]